MVGQCYISSMNSGCVEARGAGDVALIFRGWGVKRSRRRGGVKGASGGGQIFYTDRGWAVAALLDTVLRVSEAWMDERWCGLGLLVDRM